MMHWIRCGVAIGSMLFIAAGAALPEELPEESRLLKALGLSGYPAPTKAPGFMAGDVNGRRVSLEDFRGRVVLIAFWASWCQECRLEMPRLERIHQDLATRGLSVLGVNVREDDRTIGRYANELRLTFPLLRDHNGEIAAAFGVIGLPTTFLLRRDGYAAALAIGSRDWTGAAARRLIRFYLAQAVKPPEDIISP